jgi:hypothetical protein
MTSKRGSSSADRWELVGSQAKLCAGLLDAQLDVANPMRGLSDLRIGSHQIAGGILGVSVETASDPLSEEKTPWRAADVYVRGCDLVATYREPRGEPFNLQVYWRVVEESDAHATLDAIVSIQTPQWEAYPCVTVTTSLPGADAAVSENALGYQVVQNLWYAEVTRPGDFSLSHVEPASDRAPWHWRFCNEFMERGVIRRPHVRGEFNGTARPDISRLWKSLLVEPPPLTV